MWKNVYKKTTTLEDINVAKAKEYKFVLFKFYKFLLVLMDDYNQIRR